MWTPTAAQRSPGPFTRAVSTASTSAMPSLTMWTASRYSADDNRFAVERMGRHQPTGIRSPGDSSLHRMAELDEAMIAVSDARWPVRFVRRPPKPLLVGGPRGRQRPRSRQGHLRAHGQAQRTGVRRHRGPAPHYELKRCDTWFGVWGASGRPAGRRRPGRPRRTLLFDFSARRSRRRQPRDGASPTAVPRSSRCRAPWKRNRTADSGTADPTTRTPPHRGCVRSDR